MSHFNLIDEPWIPVRLSDGGREELGVRSILHRAGAITAIEDPSPLVVAALHRFLLAVLYRALEGPTDIDQARHLFNEGLPTDRIDAYLDEWHDRFWLFDDKYPFGQIADFEPKNWRAWTVLAAEHNADNAKVLFDHIDVNAPGEISAAAATRWLLATQTFSVSSGKSELAHTGTAPSATAAMVLPVGRTLIETLSYSLVPQNREVLAQDAPLWERQAESASQLRRGPDRAAVGLGDLYTWRARAVRMGDTGRDVVDRVGLASGVGVTEGSLDDPMLGYRVDDKRGKLPIQFRERGLWRDFDSLLPDEAHLAPRVVEHAAALSRRTSARAPIAIVVLGQSNDKAKIEYWRMERFAFPQSLLGDKFIRGEVRSLLADAEDAQKALWAGCSSFARAQLSRGGTRDPAKQDVSRFIGQMSVIPAYWSTLESRFHRVLEKFGLDHDPDEIRSDWLKAVHQAMAHAWDQHMQAVSCGDAWAIRALVKAEVPVSRKLRELLREAEEIQQTGDEA